MNLTGRVAVVTGAGSGIGAATTARLAAAGAMVVAADIDVVAVTAVASAIGPSVLARRLDVGERASWDELGARIGAEHEGVDILVNNAFHLVVAPAHELAEADWHRQIAVDLDAVFHSVATFIDTLQARRGSIVNVASVHALAGYRAHPAYAAAKGGMLALTRQLAVEYGPAVRVNAVAPGAILTPAWNTATEADLSLAARLTTAQRLGRPEEVAAAIAFLVSEDASYISGATLLVDGGLLAGPGTP